MRNWGAKKDLSLAQQYLFLQSNPISVGSGIITNSKLTWRFEVRPTALSRSYLIRIEYRKDNSPDVFVESPDIQLLAKKRTLPHIYTNPLRLCLYMPQAGQWLASKRIDQTIVPWISIWLFYFEEWLSSGDWKGGGEHPNGDDPISGNRHHRRFLNAKT